MEDGCLDMNRAVHVGIRGSLASSDMIKEDQEQGWLTITLDQFLQMGLNEVAKIIKDKIGDAPTVISIDADVLEPGECPGVGFPEPGHLNE